MKRYLFSRHSIVMLFVLAPLWASAGLKEYVARPDDSYSFEIVSQSVQDGMHVLTVRLTSQTWQDIVWQHWLTILRPENPTHPDKGLLFISGGNNDSPAPNLASGTNRAVMMVAQNTGATAAILNQVPNQPLINNYHEDALISYTYEKFMEGDGDDWPLLYPMVKSAVRAMDAVQTITQDKFGASVDKFLVTGGSKRGWTTWLSAVVDDRIERIAPMIIDMLNTREQMEHQKRSYGAYSQSIDDYTERDLQDRMLAGEGDHLLAQVDPYSWRNELVLPKLVLLGANDPYWTVDAANLYFDGLEGRKYLYYQANTGHDVNMEGVATLVQFFYEMLDGTAFPEIKWQVEQDALLTVTWEKPGGQALLWEALSPNRDFRKSQWTSRPLEGAGTVTVPLEAPAQGWRAVYVEVQWPGKTGLPFGVTSRIVVTPENAFPEDRAATYTSE